MKDSDNSQSWRDVIYRIWAGEYTDIGAKRGHKDAADGKPRSPFLGAIKDISFINYFWAFENALDTYTKGYDTTYMDETRLKQILGDDHVKHKENVSQGGQTTMTFSGEDSYEVQLYLLNGLLHNIYGLRETVGKLLDRYKEYIDYARSHGYMKEIIEGLELRRSQFAQIMEELNKILLKHEEKIKEHQDIIRGLMNSARS